MRSSLSTTKRRGGGQEESDHIVRLSSRSFPSDGNAFYVMLSVVMYNNHDNHREIRSKIWNLFCLKAVGITLDLLLRGAFGNGGNGDLTFCPGCKHEEWFNPWIAMFDPRRVQSIDLTMPRYGEALVTTARMHSMNGVDAPCPEFIAPLASELFGIVIVLYSGGKDQDQHPSRIWYPPGYKGSVPEDIRGRGGTGTGGGGGGGGGECQSVSTMIKHVHILQTEQGEIQLLVRPSVLARPIPTRVVGKLHLQERDTGGDRHKNSPAEDKPWESMMVKQHAIYTLGVYDPLKRVHYTIGPFIAPETKLNPEARLTHFMRLDTRLGLSKTLVFVVEGCQQTRQPVYIFATKTRQGQKQAVLIGYWPVDYCDPRIGLEETDDGLVIVPAHDKATAMQILVAECKCLMMEHR